MKRNYCILVFIVLVISCAQSPRSLESLIPEGYQLVAADSVLVDSKVEFIVTVLSPESDEDIRRLVILQRQRGSAFKSTIESDQVILCKSCGGINGDPFVGIEVEGSRLVVSHGGGTRYRWTRVSEFDYLTDTGDWILTSDLGKTYDALEPEKEIDPTIHTEITPGQIITIKDFDINNF